MPPVQMRVCSVDKCPELVSKGMCAKHKRIYRAKIDKRVGRIRGSRWTTIRKTVFTSQAGRCFCPGCVYCGKQCFEQAEEVDHIVPLKDGGHPTDRSNLRGLCHFCHLEKTRIEQRSVWLNGGSSNGKVQSEGIEPEPTEDIG